RQINPATGRTAPKPRHRDRFTTPTTRKECPSYGIQFDTWKTKVERFVPARFVARGIRQITEGDPRLQSTALGLEIELVPNHFAVCERLRVIGARDVDRACNHRSTRRK